MSKAKAKDEGPKIREKCLDLDGGMSIWRVHLDHLREMDKNARVMSPDKFERLISNISKDDRLESLPLVTHSPNREDEFLIISGHHRTRAARAAGTMTIYVLCLEGEISMDHIKAKQLSHNFLNGEDDSEILGQILKEIEDMDALIESGMAHLKDDLPDERIQVDEVMFDVDFKTVSILFLDHQKQLFEDAVGCIEKDATVMVEDIKSFELFKKAAASVTKEDCIRNIAGIMRKMSQIVLDHYQDLKDQEKE